MKLAVLGAGAIGGWLAAALAAAGIDVAIVARGASLAAIRKDGLHLTHNGIESRIAVRAGSAAELGVQDMVIVATKAHELAPALPELLALLHAGTTVVSALNGVPWWFTTDFPGPLDRAVLAAVDPGGIIARAVPVQQVVGCVVHASVARTAPGCIRIHQLDRLIFGEPAGIASDRVQWLADTFGRSGITSVTSQHIRLDIWTKLWGNMNMNPISALTGATAGRILDDPEVRTLCLRMMEEMTAAGVRIGLPFAMSAPDRIALTRRLGEFRTSMLDDLQRGTALEFGPQLGAVVEIARLVGTPAPTCAAVLGLVRLLSVSTVARNSQQ